MNACGGLRRWVAAAILAALGGCDGGGTTFRETVIRVGIRESGLGTAAEPLPIPKTPQRFTLDVHATSSWGAEATPFTGWVRVSSRPGRVKLIDAAGAETRVGDGFFHLYLPGRSVEGLALDLSGAFAETAIWAEDLGYDPSWSGTLPACADGIDNDGDGLTDWPADGRTCDGSGCFDATDDAEDAHDEAVPVSGPLPACANGIDDDGDGFTDYPWDDGCLDRTDHSETGGSGASGTGPVIHYQNPSLAQVQGGAACSPFSGEAVRVTAGTMIVTRVAQDGMYITDVTDADGDGYPDPYGHLYVYSFSRPMSLPMCTDSEEGEAGVCGELAVPVHVCDRVNALAGGITEFIGFTELNFPDWELFPWKPGKTCPIPKPYPIKEADLYDNVRLEGYESALVQLRNVTVTCTQGDKCKTDKSYAEYQEWYVNVGKNKVYVVSADAWPEFDPFLAENHSISSIVGTLRNLAFCDPDETGVKPACCPNGSNMWIVEPRCPDDIVVTGEPKPIGEACVEVQ